MPRKLKIVAINFDQPHMEQLLRLAMAHPNASITALCDANAARLQEIAKQFGVEPEFIFRDPEECLSRAKPDLVITCPSAGARLPLIDCLSAHKVAVLLDKPFAANASQAAYIAERMKDSIFAVNWPLAFYPEHVATKRLIDEGAIGEVLEIHYFGGNKGPLFDRDAGRDASPEQKAGSWWYDKNLGGGSLSDYLGYGVTLGAWFMNSAIPIEVTAVTDDVGPQSVDTHSATIARFSTGLSTYRTRWGTVSDPWVEQTLPKSGFVVVGRAGSIASYDYTGVIELQTAERTRTVKAAPLLAPNRNVVEHILHCVETQTMVRGPVSAELSLLGQRIMDAAAESASLRKTVQFA